MAEPRLAALCDEHEEVPAAPLPDRDATRPGKATGRGARRAKGAQKVAAERKHGDAALVVLTHKQLLARAGERPRSRDSTREAALAVRAQVTCAKDWGLATGFAAWRRSAFSPSKTRTRSFCVSATYTRGAPPSSSAAASARLCGHESESGLVEASTAPSERRMRRTRERSTSQTYTAEPPSHATACTAPIGQQTCSASARSRRGEHASTLRTGG
mmetsp:Transcript_10006/g.29266  ORF Transcript_10006/g.29266 Transcript_10006/m.29266 type:complete len:215 (-) Transcript_10006:246-890(-)